MSRNLNQVVRINNLSKLATASLRLGAAAALLLAASGCGTTDQGMATLKGAPAGYTGVQPIIARECVACHSGAHPTGGLNLSSYPFTSTHFTTQQQIVAAMVARLSNAAAPMPPAAMPVRPTAAEIGQFNAWLAGGAF